MGKNQNQQDPENQEQQPPVASSDKRDLVGEIGTLTYARAVKAFGKNKALSVLHQVAEIGGHGKFDDNDFLSPLFGGLQMPSASVVTKPDLEILSKLPDAEFHIQQAQELYQQYQQDAENNRSTINDLFNEHILR